MFRSFFCSPEIVYTFHTCEYNFWPPSRQALKQQLTQATLALAHAKTRSEARQARELIDGLLSQLNPAVSPRLTGGNEVSHRSFSHKNPLRLAQAKYRR